MLDKEFERIGHRLFAEHLVGGNFGNLSLRTADGFYITTNGAYLDMGEMPIHVPFEGPVPGNASSEFRVHREIYETTAHDAVVHAHPPYSVSISFSQDLIRTRDSEGLMFCPEIPVVEGEPGTVDLALRCAEALKESNIVIARGHGTFAAGKTLDEGYLYTSIAEHSCKVLLYSGLFGRF
jgi:L-fuculose-phosphate aldolase